MFSRVHMVPWKHQRAGSEMGATQMHRCYEVELPVEATVSSSPMETASGWEPSPDNRCAGSQIWVFPTSESVSNSWDPDCDILLQSQSKTHLPVTTESRREKNLSSEIRQNAMPLEVHQDTPESLMRWQESFGLKKKKSKQMCGYRM